MKKIYTMFFIAALFLAVKSNATVHPVFVSNFAFTPSTVNAVCGDTIGWILQSGTHTTTSTSVPTCATSWNGSLSSTSPAYAYVVPCAGTYSYTCTIHPTMLGTINVTCPSGINEPVKNTSISLYPNPCMDKLTVNYENADEVSIFNMVGEKMMDVQLNGNSGSMELNVAELSSGVYFVAIMKEGTIVETKKITKQ